MRRLNKQYWPVQIKVSHNQEQQDQAVFWCRENMPGKYRWILAGPNNWYFKENKDATMFSLRWA